jgi:hypothetical protein
MQNQCPLKENLLRPESKAGQLKESKIHMENFGREVISLPGAECGYALGARMRNDMSEFPRGVEGRTATPLKSGGKKFPSTASLCFRKGTWA